MKSTMEEFTDEQIDKNCVDFAIWLQDNYSQNNSQGGKGALSKGFMREDFTNNVFPISEIYQIYKTKFPKENSLNIESSSYNSWKDCLITKKSGKPFKMGGKFARVESITINEHSGKIAFDLGINLIVDCHQCELVMFTDYSE